VQALPSVVQVALLDGTGRSAHLPSPPQLPVQHSAPEAHPAPTVTHAAVVHLFPTQLRLQHSELSVQASSAAAQNVDEVHFPIESHVVEQHWVPAVQLSPPPRHTGLGGASHAPFVHFPEQQSLAAEHWAAAARHWFAGSTHRWLAQEFVQQSALEPQTSPTALHCVASTQVPVHAVEQHSEGKEQVAARSLQVSDPPSCAEELPEWLPHAARRMSAATTGTRGMATSMGIE
jgi:hypothetical protein